jgi:hypothetical protein
LNAWDRTSEKKRKNFGTREVVHLCDGADDVVAILAPGMRAEGEEGKGRGDEEEDEEAEERWRRTHHSSFFAWRWRREAAGVGFEGRKGIAPENRISLSLLFRVQIFTISSFT